jgi:hypothetical protein
MNLQRTANSVLTVCLSQGDNRKPWPYTPALPLRVAFCGRTSQSDATHQFDPSRKKNVVNRLVLLKVFETVAG